MYFYHPLSYRIRVLSDHRLPYVLAGFKKYDAKIFIVADCSLF